MDNYFKIWVEKVFLPVYMGLSTDLSTLSTEQYVDNIVLCTSSLIYYGRKIFMFGSGNPDLSTDVDCFVDKFIFG